MIRDGGESIFAGWLQRYASAYVQRCCCAVRFLYRWTGARIWSQWLLLGIVLFGLVNLLISISRLWTFLGGSCEP